MASTAFSLDRFLDAAPLDRVRAVEDGLPASAVRELVADGAVTLGDLATVVARRRTLDRRIAEDEALTLEEGDRFARLVGIITLAAGIFGGRREAMAWLRMPKARFGEARPLDLMRTQAGADLVEALLQQARHGMLA